MHTASGVVVARMRPQVGFGVYPVVVKKFATQNKADPVVFSFYRYIIVYECACSDIEVWCGLLSSDIKLSRTSPLVIEQSDCRKNHNPIHPIASI